VEALTVNGKPIQTSFMRGSGEQRTTTVSRAQAGAFRIHSGLKISRHEDG